MTKKSKSLSISKYIFLSNNSIQFVFYKVDLEITKNIYDNLAQLFGYEKAQNEYQDAIDGDSAPPSFIIGLGSSGHGVVEVMYALMYAEETCFIGSGIDINEPNLILYNGYGYSVTTNQNAEVQADSLLLIIDHANEKIISSIVEIINSDFLLDANESDDELISPFFNLTKALKKFKKDGNVYTQDWDDIDDLAGLSRVWPFTLSFDD